MKNIFKGSDRVNSFGKHFLGYTLCVIVAFGLLGVRLLNSNKSIRKIYLVDKALENENIGQARSERDQIEMEVKRFNLQWKKHGKEIMEKARQEMKEIPRSEKKIVFSINDLANTNELDKD